MKRDDLLKELQDLRRKIAQIEIELEAPQVKAWPPKDYYTTYYILAGFVLGFFGAAASLLFNVIGSIIVQQHPLQLIRVFLTFPLGADALAIDSGATLALGCCLYLVTGSVYGAIFHVLLTRFFVRQSIFEHWIIATFMGLALWVFNFYGVLSWAQPMFFGGSWIVDMIPIWVAALTHVIFIWTVFVLGSWGRFTSENYS